MLTCPCCGYRGETFLPFGVIPRPNAMCPRCRSLERHRLLWRYFTERTNLLDSRARVLHIAPERWLRDALRSRPLLAHVSLDLESPDAQVHGDVTRLPFPDASFDVVLCNHVLEHVPDDLAAMRELVRVLTPSGWAVLQTPIDTSREDTYEDWSISAPADRERHFGQRDHVRVYGRDYTARLAAAGFGVRVETFASDLPAAERASQSFFDEPVYIGVRAEQAA